MERNAIIDGKAGLSVPVEDRGLAYGDGLFETMRFVAGVAPLWRGHMTRLAHGCRRLRLTMPDRAQLLREASTLAAGADCMIKLILTRGDGRGYAPASDAKTRRVLLRLPLPVVDANLYRHGARLRWCRLQLASQPALAGLKHLNRLEQVLARGEWRDHRIYEGLLCDGQERVIGATAANLFVVRGGRVLTPRLDGCGVAGVARAFILARARRGWPVEETVLRVTDIEDADELFLSNAVRGIVPVRALAGRRWSVGPVTARLGYTLAALGIGVPPTQMTA